ncbi:MAG: cytosine/adenosine deaminase-related metal-dependent hydrolase [Desulforhopalus sp.]|jgi:cytosine/adenosine deaminase-related metal-dependent hydrolase
MTKSLNNTGVRIVTAPWVLTFTDSAVRDGAVALCNGRIVAVGKRTTLVERYPDACVDHYRGVLMPALINAHAHLELSHLAGDPPLDHAKSFTDWVEALLARRFETTLSESEVVGLRRTELQNQYDSGVVFLGDIGNGSSHTLLSAKDKPLPEVYHMLELLGSSRDAQDLSLERLARLDSTEAAVAHAPYSTRPELLKEIKKRCTHLGHIFSIHTAEVAAEKDFINSQKGQFYEFLQKRGLWDGSFFDNAPTSDGTIDYFSNLGLLDEQTLLVHCIHLSNSDLDIIRNSGVHICVCPGSNSFLHSGVAPIERMMEHGILPAIGTDSLASNHCLDMWVEMQRISAEHPAIQPVDILKMATEAGAKAFGRFDDFGSLSAGKRASFLHLYSEKINNCNSESDLLKMLVTYGRPEKIEWIQQFSMSSRSN